MKSISRSQLSILHCARSGATLLHRQQSVDEMGNGEQGDIVSIGQRYHFTGFGGPHASPGSLAQARLASGFAVRGRAAGMLLGLLLARPMSGLCGGTVDACNESVLRAALAGGGLVTFACDGTIPLSAPLLITNATALDATGHTVVLSGNKTVRVFEVLPGASVSLTNLTIADGAANRGAGLLNQSGKVVCTGCVFRGNEARGTNGLNNASGEPAAGGAIWCAGPLTLLDSRFETNCAVGGNGDGGNYGGGGEATGGAIHAGGFLTLSNAVFLNNEAHGGRSGRGDTGWGPNGADAGGGAVYCAAGLEVVECVFRGNAAVAGWPGGWRPHRGDGRGGALAVAGGAARLWGGLFESNAVSGCAGLGGGIWHGGQSLWVSNVTFRGNTAGGDKLSYYHDESGGPGAGGGLCAQARCEVVDSTFERNRSNGGPGNQSPIGFGLPAGPGLGGAVFSAAPLWLERPLVELTHWLPPALNLSRKMR